jgi:uncharacterized protein YggU (UPF0235/DUF167 family)
MIRLAVRAHPAARHERAEWLPDGTLGVWVRARPIEGQANAAIERCLAAWLDLRPRQVTLVGGATSRDKVVQVDLPSADEVRERLVAADLAHGVRARSR